MNREFAYERDMRPVVGAWLESRGFVWVGEGCTPAYFRVDIVAGRFAERTSRHRPTLLECVTVELKLSNVARVLAQAEHNQNYVNRSYVAMPASRCKKFRDGTFMNFESKGIGLLAVTPKSVEVVMPATRGVETTHEMIEKNLWRRCAKRK